MTQNQIAFHNARENERHNKAMELENNRHNIANEAIDRWRNAISSYANALNNAHYVRQDSEIARSNRVNEQLQYQRNIISGQANAINAASVSESVRHNKEQERINDILAANTIRKTQADVSYTSANADLIRATLGPTVAKLQSETGKNIATSRSAVSQIGLNSSTEALNTARTNATKQSMYLEPIRLVLDGATNVIKVIGAVAPLL